MRLSSLDTVADSTWNSSDTASPSMSTVIEQTSGVVGVGMTELGSSSHRLGWQRRELDLAALGERLGSRRAG